MVAVAKAVTVQPAAQRNDLLISKNARKHKKHAKKHTENGKS